MSDPSLDIVVLGLSITSSWGNGHATTYRGLLSEMDRRGHRIQFLERDVPWYATHRDLPNPPYAHTVLYDSLEELKDRWASRIREADVVIVGSYVPDGIEVGRWVAETAEGLTAFYDIDTPITLQSLEEGTCEYLTPDLIPRYHLYLSFTGGPTLRRLENEFGAQKARALYCSVDPEQYGPEQRDNHYDLGYMGTYSSDRQPPLRRLLLEPARRWPNGRFIVAGPEYPDSIHWPDNVERTAHLPPAKHRRFYNTQRYTLNITRAAMKEVGYAPSVRLFEAGACGIPIISDPWDGLDTFFELGEELLVSRSAEETLHYLRDLSEERRRKIGNRARERVLSEHTNAHRAQELEQYLVETAPSQEHTITGASLEARSLGPEH